MTKIETLNSLIRTAILNKTSSVIIETKVLAALIDVYEMALAASKLANEGMYKDSSTHYIVLDDISYVLDGGRNCFITLESEI